MLNNFWNLFSAILDDCPTMHFNNINNNNNKITCLKFSNQVLNNFWNLFSAILDDCPTMHFNNINNNNNNNMGIILSS